MWLVLVWGFLGQSSQLRALCSGFGGDAAYFPCVLWDNLTQPRTPTAACGNCFVPPEKTASSPQRSGSSTDPSSPGASFVSALCSVTLLWASGKPGTVVPSFSLRKTSVDENWKEGPLLGETGLFFTMKVKHSLLLTATAHEWEINVQRAASYTCPSEMKLSLTCIPRPKSDSSIYMCLKHIPYFHTNEFLYSL